MGRFSLAWKLILYTLTVFALSCELFAGGRFLLRGLVYFTIQSNILVLSCLFAHIAIPGHQRAKSLLRGVSLLAIILTGIVYNFIIFSIFLDWGTAGYSAARTITHVVVPIGFLLDWLIFDSHGDMKWKDILAFAVYPFAYFVVSVTLSKFKGLSLYGFFDMSKGLGQSVQPLILLVGIGIAICFSVVALDKLLPSGKGRKG